jgi:hypothetical protein
MLKLLEIDKCDVQDDAWEEEPLERNAASASAAAVAAAAAAAERARRRIVEEASAMRAWERVTRCALLANLT